MSIVRQVLNFQLIFEPLQRMYVVTDGIHYSLWFDSYTKDELLVMDDDDFVTECENMLEDY
jgi:hypothetical protein